MKFLQFHTVLIVLSLLPLHPTGFGGSGLSKALLPAQDLNFVILFGNKAIRLPVNDIITESDKKTSAPSFFTSLILASELALSFALTVTCLVLVFIGVVNGAYVLCTCSVHLIERHEVFTTSKQKESKTATLLHKDCDYNITDKKVISFFSVVIVLLSYLAGVNSVMSIDSLVRFATFVELKTALLCAGSLTAGILLLGKTVTLRDVIRLFSSLMVEMIVTHAVISSCDQLETDLAVMTIGMATCTVFAFVISQANVSCSTSTGVNRVCPTLRKATLFLQRGVGETFAVCVDLGLTGKDLLEIVTLDHPTIISPSSRLTWCGKSLRCDIPLMEYGVHNMSTLFIEDGGLKGGADHHSQDDDDGDEDQRDSLLEDSRWDTVDVWSDDGDENSDIAPPLQKEMSSTQTSRRKSRKRKTESVRLSERQMHADHKENCCPLKCLQRLSFKDFKLARTSFWEDFSEKKQRQFLFTFFQVAGGRKASKASDLKFIIEGTEQVCRKAWLKAHHISNGRFYSLWAEFKNGRTTPTSSKKKCPKALLTKTLKARAWLEELIRTSGDSMPHEDRVCLPSCLTKRDIYKMYLLDMTSQRSYATVSWQTFRSVWVKYFSYVTIPKESRFTKCGVCVLLKDYLKVTKNKEKREELMILKQYHNKQQMQEREQYYRHQMLASDKPHKYLSLIIDGMDQAKTNIPRFPEASKAEESSFLKTHVTGVLSHGHGKAFAFIDKLEWPHDSNLTINILVSILLKIAKKGRLPPVLYMQLDNCYRECKNRYIMAFCAFLVQKKIFKKVRLSFLMVGHTHEDVDQVGDVHGITLLLTASFDKTTGDEFFLFRIAQKLRKTTVTTLPELKDAIEKSFTPKPDVYELVELYDFKSWLEPHINTLKNHIYPHAFKFEERNGKVQMWYKCWAADDHWLPSENGGLEILSSIPTGRPHLLRPDYKKSLTTDDLKSKVQKCRVRMNLSQYGWWKEYLLYNEEARNSWASASEDELLAFGGEEWFLKYLSTYSTKDLRDESLPPQQEADMDAKLQTLVDKVNKFPKIVVARGKKTQVRGNGTLKARKRKRKGGKENNQTRKKQRRI